MMIVNSLVEKNQAMEKSNILDRGPKDQVLPRAGA
jgi:hypothetical protein